MSEQFSDSQIEIDAALADPVRRARVEQFGRQIEGFDSKQDAFEWLADELDHDCVDNLRFCFLDDPAGVGEYEKAAEYGCCGSRDVEITVEGRPARVGANYGH